MALLAAQKCSQTAMHMAVAFGVMYWATGSLAFGGLAGTSAGQASGYGVQRRYDYAYMQCMYAQGHRVPSAGGYASDSRIAPAYSAPGYSNQGYPSPPPPPAGLPPAPPLR